MDDKQIHEKLLLKLIKNFMNLLHDWQNLSKSNNFHDLRLRVL